MGNRNQGWGEGEDLESTECQGKALNFPQYGSVFCFLLRYNFRVDNLGKLRRHLNAECLIPFVIPTADIYYSSLLFNNLVPDIDHYFCISCILSTRLLMLLATNCWMYFSSEQNKGEESISHYP